MPEWLSEKEPTNPSVYNPYLNSAVTDIRLETMTRSFGTTLFRFAFPLGILLLLLQTQIAHAANTVIWKNHCDYDLYFWAIGPHTQERDDAYTRVPAHGENVHQMIWDKDGGISLKYRDVPYYTRAPAGILQAEYNMDYASGKLNYDSSIIDCGTGLGPENPYYCPFAHGGVNMYIVGDRGGGAYFCRDSFCQLGGQCDDATYLIPGGWVGEPSLSCPLGVDLVFETCTQRSVEKTWVEGQVGPAPAPAPWTPPPAPVNPPPPPPAAPWTPQDGPVTTTLFSTLTKMTPTTTTTTEKIFITVSPDPTRPSRPKTFPVPHGFPDETACFDEDCRCYGFWGKAQPGLADCTGMEGVVECFVFKQCDRWWETIERGRQERQ